MPSGQTNKLEAILLELKENGSSQEIQSYSGEEFGYVLFGRVKLHYGDRVENIKRNETFYISGQHTHYLENTTDREASVLWISTPPIF